MSEEQKHLARMIKGYELDFVMLQLLLKNSLR